MVRMWCFHPIRWCVILQLHFGDRSHKVVAYSVWSGLFLSFPSGAGLCFGGDFINKVVIHDGLTSILLAFPSGGVVIKASIQLVRSLEKVFGALRPSTMVEWCLKLFWFHVSSLGNSILSYSVQAMLMDPTR